MYLVMRCKLITVFVFLLLINVVNAVDFELAAFPSECNDMAEVDVQLKKNALQVGEEINANVIINSYGRDVNTAYTIGLYQGSIVAWEMTGFKKIPRGISSYKIYQLLGFTPKIPANAYGDWVLRMNLQVGDKCLFRTYNDIEVFSCQDGVKNGDEESIDCGGSCSLECVKSFSFPHQVIYNMGYYKVNYEDEWLNVMIKALPGTKVYKEGQWIMGSGISFYGLPRNSKIVGTYGCCCVECDESNYMFSCDYLTKGRYKLDRIGIWSCGWNII